MRHGPISASNGSACKCPQTFDVKQTHSTGTTCMPSSRRSWWDASPRSNYSGGVFWQLHACDLARTVPKILEGHRWKETIRFVVYRPTDVLPRSSACLGEDYKKGWRKR